MANFARVEIEIISIPISGQNVSVQIDSDPTYISERPLSARTGPATFTIGVNIPDSVISLRSALELDYELGGLAVSFPITVTQNVAQNKVIITATEYGHSFTEQVTPSWCTVAIIPEVAPVPEFDIDAITIQEADGLDKCGTVRYDFTVKNDVPADFPVQIIDPVSKICNTSGDLYFYYGRNPVLSDLLRIESAQSIQATSNLNTVGTYTLDNVNVLESITGATATINTTKYLDTEVPLIISYSLDNVTFQSGNIYYGLTPGSYTAYTKDQFACVKSAPFNIIGVTVDKPDPVFTISNNNSFKFFEKQSLPFTGKGDSFPNYYNSQLNEQLYFNTEKTCYYQPVQQNDDPVTQILTNYETVTAELKDLNTDEIIATLAPAEVVTNILQKDKRDCIIIGGDPGKTIIYFNGGNIYEPGTTNVISTYNNINLLLPSFLDSDTINSGVKVDLSNNAVINGNFKIEGSVSIELQSGSNAGEIAQGIQINAVYTGSSDGTPAIVESLYNALDYNVWEFKTIFTTIPDGYYYFDVNGADTDPRYEDVRWLSEPINVENGVWEKTTYIEWSNTENFEGSDYSTGIVHMLRIPARFVKYRNGGGKETFEDSSGNVVPLKEVVVTDITLETSLLPQYIVEKINLIVAHDTIRINGLWGAFSDKSEDEDLFEDQNRNYKSVAVFRLNKTTSIGGSSVISESGKVLGVGSGTFVLSIKY